VLKFNLSDDGIFHFVTITVILEKTGKQKKEALSIQTQTLKRAKINTGSTVVT
jgi:hypothetical protein